jgi:hypothetical protein
VGRNPGNAFGGRRFAGGPPRFAHDGRHHFHGRRVFGFIPGFGYDYYWYDDGSCWAWTAYGWVNLCYPYDYPYPG